MAIEFNPFSATSPAAAAMAGMAAGSAAGASGGLSGMDNDAFMMILLAQLRHQNPLEPMKDNDWMAQMTQMNSLQELKNIQASIQEMIQASQLTNAAVLVGKTVQARGEDGEIVSGKVTGVSLVGGKVVLNLGEKQVPFASLVSVEEAEEEGDDEASTGQPE
jgi:flagellar basal-body rod modification protein FlgD